MVAFGPDKGQRGALAAVSSLRVRLPVPERGGLCPQGGDLSFGPALRCSLRALVLGLGLGLAAGDPASAQEAPAPLPSSERPPDDLSAPYAPEAVEPPPPGRFPVGPFYLTPSFRINEIAFDTNVFYSATERRSDVVINGGPALDIALPLARSGTITLGGTAGYYYFLRTEPLRRFAGSVGLVGVWTGPRISLNASERYARTLSRPNYEIDRRVQQDTEATGAEVRVRLFSRLHLTVGAQRARNDVPADEEFLGQNLQETLTNENHGFRLRLDYELTHKTKVLVEGDWTRDRFRLDETRDADSYGGRVGIETSSSGLIGGHILLGLAERRFDAASTQRLATANVELHWTPSPRNTIAVSYTRGIQFSSLDVVSGTPTLTQDAGALRIQRKLLGEKVDIIAEGTIARFKSDGEERLTVDGQTTVARRDDVVKRVSLDLGYYVFTKMRVGAKGSYSDRESVFSDLGVDGLLLGLTVAYVP